MKKVYFVTGIDTDAGKSIVTGVLARDWAGRGRRVVTQKFIQTGCPGLSEDIETHRRIMGTGLLPEDLDGTTCPIVFTYPASPHLAAAIDSRRIDLLLIGNAPKNCLKNTTSSCSKEPADYSFRWKGCTIRSITSPSVGCRSYWSPRRDSAASTIRC